ncbi:MAG TPA: hypothetical protein VGB66_07265 [Longimicrobium sp.]|jgi:hypothetical protein
MRKLLILVALAGLTGCTPPLYMKSNILQSPGYADKSIGEGVWEVSFRTLAGMKRDHLREVGAYYRAAEVARDAGFPFFQVVRYEGWTKTLRPAGTPPDMGVPTEYLIQLTIRGVHTRDTELKCESESPAHCKTHSTEEVLRTLGPSLQQPTGGRGAAPPP